MPVGARLVAERLGEADDTVFGRRVGGAEHDTLLAGRGGDVDDPAAVLVAHAAGVQDGPGQPEDAGEVGLHDVVPQLVVEVGGDPAAAAARVVDEDVDRAEPFHRRPYEGVDGVRGAHVEHRAVGLQALLAQGLDGGGDVLGVTGADEDAVPLGGQQPGHRQADAAGGAGDEGDGSGVSGHDCSFGDARGTGVGSGRTGVGSGSTGAGAAEGSRAGRRAGQGAGQAGAVCPRCSFTTSTMRRGVRTSLTTESSSVMPYSRSIRPHVSRIARDSYPSSSKSASRMSPSKSTLSSAPAPRAGCA